MFSHVGSKESVTKKGMGMTGCVERLAVSDSQRWPVLLGLCPQSRTLACDLDVEEFTERDHVGMPLVTGFLGILE